MKNTIDNNIMEQLERAASECGVSAQEIIRQCFWQAEKQYFFEDIVQRYNEDGNDDFSDEEIEQIYAIYNEDCDSDLSHWDNVENAVREYKRRKNYKEEVK